MSSSDPISSDHCWQYLFSIVGDRVEHNDINIGYDSRHKDVEPGSGISGVPIP